MRESTCFVFLFILPYVIGDLIPCTKDRDGWFYNNGYCYSFNEIKQTRNWEQTESYCITRKSHLLSITSKEEDDFIQSVVDASKTKWAWIGLKAIWRGSDASFKWSDGTDTMNYTAWNGNEPVQRTGTWCFVRTPMGKWGASECSHPLNGLTICKKENATIQPVTKEGECLQDWYKFNKKCYKSFGDKVENGGRQNYDSALKSCQKLNSSLVIIHSQEEQDFLTAMMGELGANAWIGLKRWTTPNSHQWFDNSDKNFVYWAPSAPKDYFHGIQCTNMYNIPNVGGKWNELPCTDELDYICVMNADKTLAPITKKNPCPLSELGYVPYRNGCFRLVTSSGEDWKSAQTACARENGNLASISDTFDQAFVNSLLVNTSGGVWIGLSDMEESNKGLFSWSDGWPVYFTKWAQNEPTAETLYSRCVSLTKDNTWAVTNCTEKLAYLCKAIDQTVKRPNFTTIAGPCPASNKANWKDVGNNYCYHVESRSRKLCDEAARACGLLGTGARLASFHSAHELDVTRPLVVNAKIGKLWIGLSQKENGEYKWQDDTAADFAPWDTGYPNTDIMSHCVHINALNMKFRNYYHLNNIGYICEVPKMMPLTTERPLTIREQPLTTMEESFTTERPLTTREQPLTTMEESLTTERPLTTREQPLTTMEESLTTKEENLTSREGKCTTRKQPLTKKDEPLTTREYSLPTTETPPSPLLECLKDSDCSGANVECDRLKQKCLCKRGFVADWTSSGKAINCVANKPAPKKHKTVVLEYFRLKYEEE